LQTVVALSSLTILVAEISDIGESSDRGRDPPTSTNRPRRHADGRARWWVRQSGTANSSLTRRPMARGCMNLKWWASEGSRRAFAAAVATPRTSDGRDHGSDVVRPGEGCSCRHARERHWHRLGLRRTGEPWRGVRRLLAGPPLAPARRRRRGRLRGSAELRTGAQRGHEFDTAGQLGRFRTTLAGFRSRGGFAILPKLGHWA
jgi:hypothetical protein